MNTREQDALLGAFTPLEFFETYRVKRTKFYAEIKAGRLRAVKSGGKTLILRADAARWAASLPALETKSRAA